MLNKVALMGKVEKDPVLRMTLDNEVFCFLTLKVAGEDEEVFDVTVWKEMAEYAVTSCKKGSVVAVRGQVAKRTIERNGQSLTEEIYLSIDRVTLVDSSFT